MRLPVLNALAVRLHAFVEHTEYLLRALRLQKLIVALSFDVESLLHEFVHVVVPQPCAVSIKTLTEMIQSLVVQVVGIFEQVVQLLCVLYVKLID